MGKWWKTGAAVALAISLAACGTMNRDNNEDNRVNDTNGTQMQGVGNERNGIRNWDNARNNNFSSMHNNTRMDISEEIADAVTGMGEVDSATVLLTDKNAYVAVKLDNGAGYSRGKNTDNTGKTKPNMQGTADRTGVGGMARGASDDDGVTEEVKEKIAAKVKEKAPDVRNVYVSANPDFVGTMRGYGERFANGQPIRGMIIEFNRMVERVFPENAADGDNRTDGVNMNRVNDRDNKGFFDRLGDRFNRAFDRDR